MNSIHVFFFCITCAGTGAKERHVHHELHFPVYGRSPSGGALAAYPPLFTHNFKIARHFLPAALRRRQYWSRRRIRFQGQISTHYSIDYINYFIIILIIIILITLANWIILFISLHDDCR